MDKLVKNVTDTAFVLRDTHNWRLTNNEEIEKESLEYV